jgi:hypothetical protein
MDAKTVFSVAQALSPEELQRFYLLIQKETGTVKIVQKEIETVKVVKRKAREPIISDDESMEAVAKILKQTKETRFRNLDKGKRKTRLLVC